MNARILKSFAWAVGVLITLPLAGVGILLLEDDLAYQKVAITTALLRDGRYDPAEHHTFDRACTFPPESSLAYTFLSKHGYRKLDAIVPDTFTNWTLVLIDDHKKTFLTLYVLEPKVRFGGIVCAPKITLRTEISDGNITAYVEQERTN
jgi:hypothetical protein